MLGLILNFISGLAIFLFGMNVMGESLRALGGGHPQRLIGKLCHTPTLGLLMGVLATVLVQSSSAVTVMVVGFVNSGIMTLGQSVGVIMGANLGTTATSWLLAATRSGSGGSFGYGDWIGALPAVVGIIFIMMSRRESRRGFGYALMGFTVLILGMRLMSDSTAPLAESSAVAGMLSVLSDPVLGILCGAALTAVVQSSSAAVGILQAVAAGGALTRGAALPIILGQNIGTCITTLLSGIGAGKNARRAAFVHFYFNVIGAAAALLLMAVGGAIGVGQSYFSRPADALSIAVMHTAFNAFAAMLLLPLSHLLERLAVATVPGNEQNVKTKNNVSEITVNDEEKMVKSYKTVNKGGKKSKQRDGAILRGKDGESGASSVGGFGGYSILDERFLAAPAFAYSMACAAFLRMCELAEKSFAHSEEILAEVTQKVRDPANGDVPPDSINAADDETSALIAMYARSVRSYLTALPASGLRGRIYRLYAAVGDAQSIGEYSARLSDLAQRMLRDSIRCGDATCEALSHATEAVRRLFVLSAREGRCGAEDNDDKYDNNISIGGEERCAVQRAAERAADLIDTAQRRLIDDICGGEDARAGVYIDSALTCLDRIAVHAAEIFAASDEIGLVKKHSHR